MRQGFVEVNGALTKVMTWGRWIDEKPKNGSVEDIIICIPGNPGVSKFYTVFLQRLHEEFRCPVWIMSHAGHEINRSNYSKGSGEKTVSNEMYGLQQQIKHKEVFVKKYVPDNAKIHFIGHSVGAYMITELLKDPEISKKVSGNYLLFPTLEYIGDTPNGRFIRYVFPIVPILVFLSWIFCIFPLALQTFLINMFMYMRGIPKMHQKSLLDFIHPHVLSQVFFLARQEMNEIKERKNEVLLEFESKMRLYYGTTDGWVPLSFRDNLKKDFPNINAEICSKEIEHAFVLNNSRDMAQTVSKWINELKSKELIN